MELVTGHGASEHITAAQVSRFIQGITVMDDTTVYRLNVGDDCSLVVGGLDVLINTGEMVLHGYHTTFEDAYQVTLDPTLNAAYSRIDKLCLIVSEDLTTGIQSAYIQVVQGTESANPSAPATPSTPSSLTEMYLGVGVIATVTVSDSIIASYVDNTSLYAGSFVTKTEYDNDLAQTRQMIAPIEATNVVSKVGGYVKDDRLIYNGVLYKVDASTISEGTTLVPGGNISLSPDVEAQISSLNSALAQMNQPIARYDYYNFPTSASEVSGNNNKYTVLHDGVAILTYVFSNMTYSQFSIILNEVQMHDGMITSGNNNFNGLRSTLTFPVKKGDVVRVSFFSTFTMTSLQLRCFY